MALRYSKDQYVAQHLSAEHGTDPFKVMVPQGGADGHSDGEAQFFQGLWLCSSAPAIITLFDGHPSEAYQMGDPIQLDPNGRLDLGSPGLPLTGSGLWVALFKPLTKLGKLHVFIR